MLKSFTRHRRPKQIVGVYVESQKIEVLRASRKFRTYEVESLEEITIPEKDSVFDCLQRLNIRPRSKQRSALLLFLPRLYYSLHREHYPATLRENLDEALAYDWPENIFYDPEEVLYFYGQAVLVDHHLSVPMFSLQKDIHDKFYQAAGGGYFDSFHVIPTSPNYQVFLPAFESDSSESHAPAVKLLGRLLDPSQLEIHKFYEGLLLDSSTVTKEKVDLRLFRESLRCAAFSDANSMEVHILCTQSEWHGLDLSYWEDAGLPIKVHQLSKPLIAYWMGHLFEQEKVLTFDTPVFLKPREVPKATWIVLGMIMLYSLFAYYQLYAHDRLLEKSRLLEKQRIQLEAQWKPIETLQNRIKKFQEDQKTLSQFNNKGYPVLELLALLTEITPEDTWLNYLSIRKGELMLRGESGSAIKYLTELSKIKGFDDVAFASPVTRNPSTNKERFNLKIKLNLQELRKTFRTMALEGGIGQASSGGTTLPPPSEQGSDELMAADDNATMPSPSFQDDNATIVDPTFSNEDKAPKRDSRN